MHHLAVAGPLMSRRGVGRRKTDPKFFGNNIILSVRVKANNIFYFSSGMSGRGRGRGGRGDGGRGSGRGGEYYRNKYGGGGRGRGGRGAGFGGSSNGSNAGGDETNRSVGGDGGGGSSPNANAPHPGGEVNAAFNGGGGGGGSFLPQAFDAPRLGGNNGGAQTALVELLRRLEGKQYPAYHDIESSTKGWVNDTEGYCLYIARAQSDPFAKPTRCRVIVKSAAAKFPPVSYQNKIRSVALAWKTKTAGDASRELGEHRLPTDNYAPLSN